MHTHQHERAEVCIRIRTQVIPYVVSAGQLRARIDFLGTAAAATTTTRTTSHSLSIRYTNAAHSRRRLSPPRRRSRLCRRGRTVAAGRNRRQTRATRIPQVSVYNMPVSLVRRTARAGFGMIPVSAGGRPVVEVVHRTRRRVGSEEGVEKKKPEEKSEHVGEELSGVGRVRVGRKGIKNRRNKKKFALGSCRQIII